MFNAYYNFLLEFSYWPIFSQQVYSFIVGMYFLDIFIAMGLESMLCESLLIAPIDVCINVIENTMTMGAASFVDFMVSFMVGLSITIIPPIPHALSRSTTPFTRSRRTQTHTTCVILVNRSLLQ